MFTRRYLIGFMVAQVETRALSHVNHRFLHTVEGLVQIVTAPRRSFFTNVMAQALRAAGQGKSVLVVQFLKGGINMGHQRPMRLCQHLDWFRCNLPRCIDAPELDVPERAALEALWQHTQHVVTEGDYALVVLDELSLAIHLGLIAEEDVLSLIAARPRHVDMILTGPNMPSAIVDVADQFTELRRAACL